jgi:hypothetical protein
MDLAMKLHPSRKDLDLKLEIPDQGAECPILQEPIQTAVFETFPRPFYRAHPEHKAITLSCSHTFHAMALVYHWSRNRNVLCPICRAGPKGQRLVLNGLPEDWRYSMASRVKREKRKDREEAEQENFHVARMISQEAATRTVVSFVVRIEIQALTVDNTLATWKLSTVLAPSHDHVVFEVPVAELADIPFGEGTMMRFIPFAYSNSLVTIVTPSEWFTIGSNIRSPGAYVIEYNESKKFKSVKLMLQEDVFGNMIVEAYFAASVERE